MLLLSCEKARGLLPPPPPPPQLIVSHDFSQRPSKVEAVDPVEKSIESEEAFLFVRFEQETRCPQLPPFRREQYYIIDRLILLFLQLKSFSDF